MKQMFADYTRNNISQHFDTHCRENLAGTALLKQRTASVVDLKVKGSYISKFLMILVTVLLWNAWKVRENVYKGKILFDVRRERKIA